MLDRILVPVKFYKGEMNPFDMSALESALNLGKEVIVLSMSPRSNFSAMENLTRLGAKAVLVTDSVFAGSDTLVTAKILSEAIKRYDPDCIFCGRQSVDGDTAQVPPMLSEMLSFEYYPKVMAIGEKLSLRDGREIPLKKNAVYTFEKFLTLRFPSIFSKKGEVEILTNSDLGLNENECGLKGSPTKVLRSFQSEVGRRYCKFISISQIEDIVKNSLESTKEKEVLESDEKLDTVYFFGDLEKNANAISKTAVRIFDENKSVDEIEKEIRSLNAKVILFSDSEVHKELASRLAVRLKAGLCADCISLSVENGKFIMTRPALGSSITADIECVSQIKMATVRTANKKSADVMVAVGLGATHKLEEIKRLASEKGFDLVGTRLAVDNGFMPYSTQVGLTGKMVAPKVYIAVGVSGAVQHTCAIEGAKVIIAINSDKNARIFDYADYGVVMDI